MFRLPTSLRAKAISTGPYDLESYHTTQFDWVRHAAALLTRFIPTLMMARSIKMLLEILQEEWESINVVPSSQPDRNLQRILLGLSPLFIIETNLMQVISTSSNQNSRDVCVRSGGDWKAMLKSRATTPTPSSPTDRQRPSNPNKQIDPTGVLAASKDDIVVLWEDPSVQAVLRKRNVKMEDMSGLLVAPHLAALNILMRIISFLNDIDRIASTEYEPTNGTSYILVS
jgi:hypothetical protein